MTCDFKPCPFCGSAKVEMNEIWTTAIVECTKCTASSGGFFTAAEAIAAWNRRFGPLPDFPPNELRKGR